MRIGTIFACLALAVMTTSLCLAQTTALESFAYPLTTLSGHGTAANGFGGPWVTDGGGTEGLTTICNTHFSYANLSYAIPHDTMHLQVIKSNAWSDANRYKRPLATAWANTAGKIYWLSYMVDFKDSLPVGNTYFMVKLYSGSTELLAAGKGGGRDANAPVWTCGSGWPGNAGSDVSTVAITADPTWVVVRIDMSGNATDPCRTFMWVDPNPATAPDTSVAIVKRNTTVPALGIDNIAVEFGGDGVNVRLIFDEITFANSFSDLTASTPVGTVARESFAYPLSTVVGLGAATKGFGGPWVNDANGTDGLVAVANTRFDYANLSYAIPHDTMHLQWTKSLAWSDANRYKRPLAAAWPNTAGKTYWLSYLVDVKTPLPVGNTYFMVKLFSGTTELFAAGKGGGRDANAPVWTCGSGWPGNAGTDVSAVDITAGPVWVVVRIDMSGNATDPCRTFMWVDPNPATAPDTAVAIVKRGTTVPALGIDNIALEFGGDGPGVRLIFDEICLATSFAGLTTTGVPSTTDLPVEFALSQNYPNPFNPSTKITYSLIHSGEVRLSVYDLLGQEVAVLVNGVQGAGVHDVAFDGKGLSSGTYFYRLQSAQNVTTKKMLLLK